MKLLVIFFFVLTTSTMAQTTKPNKVLIPDFQGYLFEISSLTYDQAKSLYQDVHYQKATPNIYKIDYEDPEQYVNYCHRRASTISSWLKRPVEPSDQNRQYPYTIRVGKIFIIDNESTHIIPNIPDSLQLSAVWCAQEIP